MSIIKRIVVHCTGEPANAKRNRAYYERLFFKHYGWNHYGYHAVIYQDGEWEILQQIPKPVNGKGCITNSTLANGAKGFNEDSLHIAYVGGIDPVTGKNTDTRTPEQKQSLKILIDTWKRIFSIQQVVGHYQLPNVKKSCPCFDAKKEYGDD